MSEQAKQLQQEEDVVAEKSGVKYVCGDCGRENVVRPKDPVRCGYCGYRILYKMRTKRLIQFEAR